MPHRLIRTIDAGGIPSYLTVNWSDKEASWVVIADDRLGLPPGPQLKDLRASQLLDALANGKSVAQAVREQLERAAPAQASGGIVVDPLKRFDSSSALLRRGRALGRALSNLERRLADPVATIDSLRSRLQSPIGPTYLATRMIEDYEAEMVQLSEAVFTLAEVALSVGRVDWTTTLQHVDTTEGLAIVGETIDSLSALRKRLNTNYSHDLTEYANRALEEANACLNN